MLAQVHRGLPSTVCRSEGRVWSVRTVVRGGGGGGGAAAAGRAQGQVTRTLSTQLSFPWEAEPGRREWEPREKGGRRSISSHLAPLYCKFGQEWKVGMRAVRCGWAVKAGPLCKHMDVFCHPRVLVMSYCLCF